MSTDPIEKSTRDFSNFTLEQLLDFLHASKVNIVITRDAKRQEEKEDSYYDVTLSFHKDGLNYNLIHSTIMGHGKDLRYVIHGLVKDYLMLK
jgi:hypothetical protein